MGNYVWIKNLTENRQAKGFGGGGKENHISSSLITGLNSTCAAFKFQAIEKFLEMCADTGSWNECYASTHTQTHCSQYKVVWWRNLEFSVIVIFFSRKIRFFEWSPHTHTSKLFAFEVKINLLTIKKWQTLFEKWWKIFVKLCHSRCAFPHVATINSEKYAIIFSCYNVVSYWCKVMNMRRYDTIFGCWTVGWLAWWCVFLCSVMQMLYLICWFIFVRLHEARLSFNFPWLWHSSMQVACSLLNMHTIRNDNECGVESS